MKALLCAITVLLFLRCVGLGADRFSGRVTNSPPENASQSEKDIEAIISVLRNCPPFIDVYPTNVQTRRAIVDKLNTIRKFSLETIKAAEKAVVKSGTGESFRVDCNIYVLHRLLFRVPRRAKGDAARTFGGFWVHSDGKGLHILWPLKETAEGGLVLTGYSEGLGYMGPGYDPIAEFDFFRKTFGLRKVAK